MAPRRSPRLKRKLLNDTTVPPTPPWHTLCKEVLAHIFRLARASDAVRASAVCKDWHECVTEHGAHIFIMRLVEDEKDTLDEDYVIIDTSLVPRAEERRRQVRDNTTTTFAYDQCIPKAEVWAEVSYDFVTTDQAKKHYLSMWAAHVACLSMIARGTRIGFVNIPFDKLFRRLITEMQNKSAGSIPSTKDLFYRDVNMHRGRIGVANVYNSPCKHTIEKTENVQSFTDKTKLMKKNMTVAKAIVNLLYCVVIPWEQEEPLLGWTLTGGACPAAWIKGASDLLNRVADAFEQVMVPEEHMSIFPYANFLTRIERLRHARLSLIVALQIFQPIGAIRTICEKDDEMRKLALSPPTDESFPQPQRLEPFDASVEPLREVCKRFVSILCSETPTTDQVHNASLSIREINGLAFNLLMIIGSGGNTSSYEGTVARWYMAKELDSETTMQETQWWMSLDEVRELVQVDFEDDEEMEEEFFVEELEGFRDWQRQIMQPLLEWRALGLAFVDEIVRRLAPNNNNNNNNNHATHTELCKLVTVLGLDQDFEGITTEQTRFLRSHVAKTHVATITPHLTSRNENVRIATLRVMKTLVTPCEFDAAAGVQHARRHQRIQRSLESSDRHVEADIAIVQNVALGLGGAPFTPLNDLVFDDQGRVREGDTEADLAFSILSQLWGVAHASSNPSSQAFVDNVLTRTHLLSTSPYFGWFGSQRELLFNHHPAGPIVSMARSMNDIMMECLDDMNVPQVDVVGIMAAVPRLNASFLGALSRISLLEQEIRDGRVLRGTAVATAQEATAIARQAVEEVQRLQGIERERDNALQLRDEALWHHEDAVAEAERLRCIERERNDAIAERDNAIAWRNAYEAEAEHVHEIERERDEALAQRDATIAEQEAAKTQRDIASAHRAAAAEIERWEAERERDEARAQRDAAEARHDEALAEVENLRRELARTLELRQ
ncbi:hypothetical protein NFJ02_11g06890 [Pycnococcus provasolii]